MKRGVKPTFGSVPTKKLRIDRIVPISEHDEMKRKANEFINQLQSEYLTKCSDEALKSHSDGNI